VKDGPHNYKLVKAIYELLSKYNTLEFTCITAFNPMILLYFRILDRKLSLSMSVERTSSALLRRIEYSFLTDVIANKLGVSLLLVQDDLLSIDFIKRKARDGVQVLPWTINSPADKAFYRQHNIGYLTDNLNDESIK
jgi:hypothetical protein